MAQYRNFCTTLFFLMLISILKLQAQVVSNSINDSLSCYLTFDHKSYCKNCVGEFCLKLFIYNTGGDSVVVKDFNKNIYHASCIQFKVDEKRDFFWNLYSLSDKEPENIVMISPFAPTIKTSKKHEKNFNVIIPPHSLFNSCVVMLHTPFLAYPEGFYKLRLFYKDNCIAETIVEIE